MYFLHVAVTRVMFYLKKSRFHMWRLGHEGQGYQLGVVSNPLDSPLKKMGHIGGQLDPVLG